MRIQISIISAALLVAACGKLNDPGGDDEWGEPVDQTPDGEQVPEWPDAHERLDAFNQQPYVGDQPNALNGVVVDAELAATLPALREYVAFAPHTQPQPDHQGADCIYCGWPSKPWMKGIPEFPYWEWNANNHPFANEPWSVAKSDWGSERGDLRSGLIGNFGLYTPSLSATDGELLLYCPDEHPRPPICTNFFAQVGHPLIAGRYNVYGLPCSFMSGGYGYVPGEASDCFDHYDVGTSPAAPGIPPTVPELLGNAECLASGPTYRPELSLLTSGNRNGLTWLNLREMGDLLHFIADTTEAADILLNAIPWWDYTDSQWNYVNVDDTPWRWSEMSMTGVCSFGADLLMKYDGGPEGIPPCILTQLHACPKTHLSVFPPFNQYEMSTECVQDLTETYHETVPGFCGLPFFDFIANEAALLPDGSIDPIVQLDVTSNGYHRGFSLRFDAMPDTLLTEWSRSLVLTPSSDGIVVTLPAVETTDPDSASRRALGESLLTEFGLLPGDRLVSFTSACWDDESCDRDMGVDLRSSAVNVLDVLLVMQDRWLHEQAVALWIERDDGMVLPTYLFPVFVPTGDDTHEGTDDTTADSTEG